MMNYNDISSTGGANVAVGTLAYSSSQTGGNSVAVGFAAANDVGNGIYNSVYIGANAGNTPGPNPPKGPAFNNIVIGNFAASAWTNTENNNICIGNSGQTNDARTIRIGDESLHVGCFIAGISGQTTGTPNAAVFVDNNGQLGTVSSSMRYKTDIQQMNEYSSAILDLQPVTFHYKKGDQSLQVGLIAEDVEKVKPDLVYYKNGQVESVLYQNLVPMLLNEHIKLNKQVQALQQKLDELTK
jgi:hypothetical protein